MQILVFGVHGEGGMKATSGSDNGHVVVALTTDDGKHLVSRHGATKEEAMRTLEDAVARAFGRRYDVAVDMISDVRGFQHAAGIPMEPSPLLPPGTTTIRRVSRLREEFEEYLEAEEKRDLAKIARELIDIIYVAIGTMFCYGLPVGQLFRVVHLANLAKGEPDGFRRTPEGKIIKPPGWRPPAVSQVIARAMRRADPPGGAA